MRGHGLPDFPSPRVCRGCRGLLAGIFGHLCEHGDNVRTFGPPVVCHCPRCQPRPLIPTQRRPA